MTGAFYEENKFDQIGSHWQNLPDQNFCKKGYTVYIFVICRPHGCLLFLNLISFFWSFYLKNPFLWPMWRNILNYTNPCQHCCMSILAAIKQAFGGGGGTKNLWYKLELWIALWLCAPSVKLGCLNREKARNSHKSQIAVLFSSLITLKVWFCVNKKCTVSILKYWMAFKSI